MQKKKKRAWHFAFLSKGPETNFFFFWPYNNLVHPNMARQQGSIYITSNETFRFCGINLVEPSQTVHQWMEFGEFATDGYILTLYMKLINVNVNVIQITGEDIKEFPKGRQ